MQKENQLPTIRMQPIQGLGEKLAALGSPIARKIGAILFEQGAVLEEVFLVEKGLVALSILSETGKLKTIALCPPGMVIGEICAFGTYVNVTTALAIQPTQLVRIPNQRLGQAFSADPELALQLFKSLASKLQFMTNHLGIISLLSTSQILAMILLDYQGKEIPLSHETLATMVGCARITVTRYLDTFKELGVIDLEWRKIVIRDSEALKGIALGEPGSLMDT